MTGKTLAGKLADVRLYSEGQEMIHSLDNIKKDSRLVSLAFPAAKGAGLLRLAEKKDFPSQGRLARYSIAKNGS